MRLQQIIVERFREFKFSLKKTEAYKWFSFWRYTNKGKKIGFNYKVGPNFPNTYIHTDLVEDILKQGSNGPPQKGLFGKFVGKFHFANVLYNTPTVV